MFRALIALALVSLHLAAGAVAPKPVTAADVAPQSSWQQVGPDESPSASSSYDITAEHHLLDMANADRARAGLPPLRLDQGLTRAARAHAAEMASQNQLSHQFPGEPPLIQRISANSDLHLNREGENVAMAGTPNDAHKALMNSPPHRDNLLSPNFNVAGFGVIRDGNRLYVAQDFGSSLATYSLQQAQQLVSESVEQLRIQSKLPRLQRVDSRNAQSSACAMAQADSLNAAAAPAGAYMLRYTSMTPDRLPDNVSRVIAQRGLHTYSAGTCYARTQKYPGGAYWVVLVFD
jgi:uncharacterized protein YkwD